MSRSGPPQKFALIVLVLVFSCVGIILNAVAFGTEYWIVFHGSYRLDSDGSTSSSLMDDTNYTSFTVDINAGLFRGVLVKCCRPTKTDVFNLKEEYFFNKSFMNFGLWVSMLVFLALGITFGCFSAVMSAINAVITPIELITGIVGLYLWNGLTCLFCVISLVLYAVQYSTHFAHIAKGLSDHYHILGKMENQAKLDYSFYMVVAAASIYLFNNVLVFAAMRRFEVGHNRGVVEVNHAPANGVVMLY